MAFGLTADMFFFSKVLGELCFWRRGLSAYLWYLRLTSGHCRFQGEQQRHCECRLRVQGMRDYTTAAWQAMLSAILLCEDQICESGVECLRDIEHLVGKDCLTKGYVKLQRICAVCAKIAEASKVSCPNADPGASTRSCVLYVLQALRFSLRYELLSPHSLTCEKIDTKRDGSPGLIRIILARKFMIGHVRRAMEDVRGVADA